MMIIKSILITLLVIFIIICFAVFSGLVLNKKSTLSANEFCQTIVIGDNINKAISLATEQGIRKRFFENQGIYDFVFQGWVFNASVCRAEVSNGKVISRKEFAEGD